MGLRDEFTPDGGEAKPPAADALLLGRPAAKALRPRCRLSLRQLRPGWWIAPGALVGLLFWAVIIAAIFRA